MGKFLGVIGVLVVGGVLAAIPVVFTPSRVEAGPVQASAFMTAQPGISEQFFDEKKRAADGEVLAQF